MNTHLHVKISILKYCFIVELFEKWHFALPPSRTRAPHSGDSFGRFGDQIWRLSTWGVAQAKPHMGGWLGLPSRRLSPTNKELVFCLVLLNCMTSGMFSLCYILLFKSSFRGTATSKEKVVLDCFYIHFNRL